LEYHQRPVAAAEKEGFTKITRVNVMAGELVTYS